MPGVSLRADALLGTESAAKYFDVVILWCFRTVLNAPAGDVQRDAAELLCVEDRDAILESNVTVAHVSDVVRFRAAALLGGWVVDCDLIWLRKPPADRIVFATLFAKNAGSMLALAAKHRSQLRREQLIIRYHGYVTTTIVASSSRMNVSTLHFRHPAAFCRLLVSLHYRVKSSPSTVTIEGMSKSLPTSPSTVTTHTSADVCRRYRRYDTGTVVPTVPRVP